MSVEGVQTTLGVVDSGAPVPVRAARFSDRRRDRRCGRSCLFTFAIFSGFRPGEMLGLPRRHVALDCSSVIVEHRVYRGVIDVPKTDPSAGEVAIPPRDGRVAARVDGFFRRSGARRLGIRQ